ncbi:MAG: hypothetical protein NT039_03075 [Candidatus Berkelbacteria bacterium]|nr:hypothetical protein [Candidatus Berkelbacteria bacterium]
MDQNAEKKLDEILAKAKDMKREQKLDLSSDEDLSIAVMNLVSIEEHFFFTGAKTGNKKYYDMILEVREMRKQLLKKLLKNTEGEMWCISKHLLAASMRLMEVGTKQLGAGNKEEAYELFEKAYNIYALFWGLNLKVVDTSDIKEIDENAINKHDQGKKGFMGKLGDLVKKVIDCCIE